jgi:hypothetical protein
MALPTALFALVASVGLATVAIFSSIDAQRGTKNDSERKSAIAAADAGASVALLRLNRFQSRLTTTTPCIGPAGEAWQETSPGSGWCAPLPAETVGGSSFAYQVSAFDENARLSVISVGTAGTVSRRVEVDLYSFNGKNVFADEHLIGEDQIELEGTVDVRTDVGTNGDITGKGSYTLCGNARHGIGKQAPQPDCEKETLEGNKELPEILAPTDIAVNNSNCRLWAGCPKPDEVDTYTKKVTSTNPWYDAGRTINVAQNATLSMGGKDYWTCGLDVNNGQLIMLANSHVRIFVDTPEHCGLSAGAVQVRITGNANIVSTGYNPDEGMFDVPGIYVLGSPNIPTVVDLSGNSGTNELMLYAPYSHIDIGGSATWIGMIAGNSIRLHGTPEVKSDDGVEPPDITLSSLWLRNHYVECTGATASPPDASC